MLRMNTLLWQAQHGPGSTLRHASESILKEVLSHDGLPATAAIHPSGTLKVDNSVKEQPDHGKAQVLLGGKDIPTHVARRTWRVRGWPRLYAKDHGIAFRQDCDCPALQVLPNWKVARKQ